MSDGANYGIGAERAIDTILGGKPSPKEDEGMTPQEMYDMLMEATDPPTEWSYGSTANVAAKRVLKFLIDHPEYRDLPADGDYDWTDRENYTGFHLVKPGLSETMKEHGVDVDKGLGLSGFQYGWAVNAAKYAIGAPPVANPALLTVKG